MLHYLNAGKRDYYSRPVYPHRRPYWEIQAVVEGRAALIPDRSAGGFAALSASREPSRRGKDSLQKGQATARSLEAAAAAWKVPLREIYNELLPHYRNPSITGNYYFRKALYELCILFLEAWPERPSGSQDAEDEQRVYSAIAWFNENMRPTVGVEEAAAAVNCSGSHLRRLFGEVIGRSPREVFQEQQMKRTREFLRETDLSIEQIAEYCSFSSISTFSRAFKGEESVSPLEYRRN